MAATQAPPGRTRLRIASTAIAASIAPLWLAQDTGIFERNGLDVEIVTLPAGPQAVQAMVAGELQVAYNVASSLISANLGGADLVMIAGGVNTMIFSISVVPGIERIEDLRGKRLGITRLGTSSDFNARYVLARYGLQADTDVAFIQLNGIPDILTGLHAGAIDAGMLSHPIVVQAREQGFRPLLDLGTLGIPYQHTVMSTRRYVEAHPDAIRAVVRSHVEAIQRFKSDRAAAIETLARWTKLSEPLLLDETYDAYANVYFERVPYVTIPGHAARPGRAGGSSRRRRGLGRARGGLGGQPLHRGAGSRGRVRAPRRAVSEGEHHEIRMARTGRPRVAGDRRHAG